MNLHDVARKAGVSIATVSRVLNNQDIVKAPTRTRVLKALDLLNYHPNVNARTLCARSNRTLALIVSNLENPFFVDVYRFFEKLAHREGYEVLVADTDFSPERLAASVRLMLGRRVAGLGAVVSEMDDGAFRDLSRSKIPVVISGVDAASPNITNIRINCEKGMQRLLDHLRSLRHKKLAFFECQSTLQTISERRKALLDAIQSFEAPSYRVFAEEDSPEGGRQGVRDMLAVAFKPTAVICVNDHMAIGALSELLVNGFRVPEDISISGFDDISYAEFLTPALTTVHIDRERIARLIFENLVRQGDAVQPRREIVVDPQLVVRESTGPAASV
jgi:LacI family transcriptional regulator